MGKKIFFWLAGIAGVCGLALTLVGYCLGGGFGSFRYTGGWICYIAAGDVYPVFRPPWIDESPWAGSGVASAPAPAPGSAGSAPFTAEELRSVDIELSAAHLVVKSGGEFGLEVDGPMDYTSDFRKGRWEIRSSARHITTRIIGGLTHFFSGGEDITTTFTLTLPGNFHSLSVDVDMGEVIVSGLTLAELDCSSDMGNMRVENVSASRADFEADMGQVVVTGFEGTECELSAGMGRVDFEGSVTDSLKAGCNMGSVTARVPRPARYGFKTKNGMGSIKLDGRNVADGMFGKDVTENPDAMPFFSLDCDMGSIEIIFT